MADWRQRARPCSDGLDAQWKQTSDARTPSPQPKSDLSDLGHFKSAELGQARVRMGEGRGEGVTNCCKNSETRPPSPGMCARKARTFRPRPSGERCRVLRHRVLIKHYRDLL